MQEYFLAKELNPEETQHIQINTETQRQGQPPHNTLMLLLNTKNSGFPLSIILILWKIHMKEKGF